MVPLRPSIPERGSDIPRIYVIGRSGCISSHPSRLGLVPHDRVGTTIASEYLHVYRYERNASWINGVVSPGV